MALVRQVLIDEIIRRFPDYLDEVAARGVRGVVGWQLVGFGDEIDHFTMVIEDGVIKIGQDLSYPPTVTLRLGVVSFLKLATGNGDPSTMVLSGDLDLDGDSGFALDLLRMIRIPTAAGPVRLGGPGKVDVGAIARLVRQVPAVQLAARLRGPVRRILLDEIFRRMPGYLVLERAAKVDALIAWQITGRDGGGHDEYRTLVRRGECTVGALSGRPRTVIRTDPVTFCRLVTGNANPVRAVLARRLVLRGDLLFASRLPRMFHIPRG